MKELRLTAVTHGELKRVSVSFDAGMHVVLGHERDGTSTLLLLAAGLEQPTSGQVLVNERAPWSSASTRRGIAALLAEEVLLPGRHVESSVALALRARGDARPAFAVLEAAGLAPLAKRPPGSLNAREARAVALALALSHPAPVLVLLHEPLGLLGLVNETFVLTSLTQLTATGALVLCTANRFEDAARLGPLAGALERGAWIAAGEIQAPLGSVTLRVHTPEPRRLAARLSEAPDITGVEWSGGPELLVRGAQLELVAHSVVTNARAESIRITALKQDHPALEALAATRAGLAQANYERARSGSDPRPQ